MPGNRLATSRAASAADGSRGDPRGVAGETCMAAVPGVAEETFLAAPCRVVTPVCPGWFVAIMS